MRRKKSVLRAAVFVLFFTGLWFGLCAAAYGISVGSRNPEQTGSQLVEGMATQDVGEILAQIRREENSEMPDTLPEGSEEIPVVDIGQGTAEMTESADFTDIGGSGASEEQTSDSSMIEPTEPTEPGPSQQQILQQMVALWTEQLNTGTVQNLSQEEQEQLHRQFRDTVFFGDSMTQAIGEYGFLDMSQIVYKRSATVDVLLKQVTEVAALYPRRIVIFTGLNDCNHYQDIADYQADYVALVSALREAIPGVQICVSSLLPPNDAVKASRADLARSDQFDAALQQLCAEQGIFYIDSHWIVRQELYLYDGIHFNRTFYRVWFRYLSQLLTDSAAD